MRLARRCGSARTGSRISVTSSQPPPRSYLAASVGDLVVAADTMDDVLGGARARGAAAVRTASTRGCRSSSHRPILAPADTDLEALERITRQLERSGFVRQGGLARRNLGLAKLGRDDRTGAADDLIAASTRLLDIDTGAAALGVAALACWRRDRPPRNRLVAASRAWATCELGAGIGRRRRTMGTGRDDGRFLDRARSRPSDPLGGAGARRFAAFSLGTERGAARALGLTRPRRARRERAAGSPRIP